MIKNIFFDIDDTLFPTTEFAHLARRNAIRAMITMGVDSGEEELFSLLMDIVEEKGSNYNHHFDELCRKLKIKSPARFIAAAVLAYHNTKTSIQPYPDVPKTLLKLRELGYSLYIATNGKTIKQWDKLLRLRIALYFEDVFVSDEIGAEKSPEFFNKVIKTLNTKPEYCIMLGDREDADILPAKSIGIKTIRRKNDKDTSSSSADFEIKEISEIIGILQSLKKSSG
jgi:putative hydrolase of the HAD superfamily